MAVNYSGVSNRSLLGRLVRLPLKLIPASAKMQIRQGPLKGRLWIAGSHTHGCWLGSYELDKQMLFAKHCKPGMVVLDIGANVGFYSLLAAHLVGSTGKVEAFEPVPRNLRYLREHVRINTLENTRVHAVAVGEAPGEITFDDTTGSATGKISARGRLKVPLVSVDALLGQGTIKTPDLMKIDVEGAEAMVLRGAARTIAEAAARGRRPIIFLATHGPEVHAECLTILRGLGYAVSSTDGRDVEATDEMLCI